MVRPSGRRRTNALVLLLVLLIGGFALPIVDGLWFHSAAIAQMRGEDHLAKPDGSGRAHLLGCAVWSSPAASTGLPELGPHPPLTPPRTIERGLVPVQLTASQHAPTLALPRAPPSA